MMAWTRALAAIAFVSFVGGVLAGVVVRAAEPRTSDGMRSLESLAWADNRVSEAIEWPKELYGLVRSADGRPFAGAKIVLEIKVQLWPLGGLYEKTVYRDETVGNAEGRFAFKTAGIPAIRRRPIVATVTASAPERLTWQTWWWYSPQDMKGEPRFGTITLASGRMVSGRVVDAAGASVVDGVLHAYDTNARSGRWVAGAIRADATGRFRFRAPAGDGVGAWVGSSRGAPQFVKLPENSGDIEIKLERGTSIDGVLLTKELKPAAGALVAAESFYNGAFRTHHLPFRLATRTDRDGRFHFPPLTGEYRFFVTEASESMASESTASKSMDASGFMETNEVPLSVAPKTETFSDAESRRVTLYAGDSSKVDGKVRWDDGSPAASSIVVATMMPAVNGPGLQLAHALTDASGHYELQLPEFVERVDVRVETQKRNGHYFRAMTSDDKEYIQLNEISSRGHHIDFTFRP
jgi:hypothetical protein